MACFGMDARKQALGGVLYKIISGKTSSPSPQRLTPLSRTREDSMPPIAEPGKDRYSDKLLSAIDRAIPINRDDRPNNITDWQRQLERRNGKRAGRRPVTIGHPEVGSAERSDDPGEAPGAIPIPTGENDLRGPTVTGGNPPPGVLKNGPITEVHDAAEEAAKLHERLLAAQGGREKPPAGPPTIPSQNPANEPNNASRKWIKRPEVTIEELRKYAKPAPPKTPPVRRSEPSATGIRFLAFLLPLPWLAVAVLSQLASLLLLHQLLINFSPFMVVIFSLSLYPALSLGGKAYRSTRKALDR